MGDFSKRIMNGKGIYYKISYVFDNGVTIDYLIEKSITNPIHKAQWSCPLTPENIKPLLDEYATRCIPKIYQQIANYINAPIMWVDKNLYYPPMTFRPNNLN